MAEGAIAERKDAVRVSASFLETVATDPDSLRQFARLINRFYKRNRGFLADAIVLLGRERLGQKVILAPDFELLHSYLFPSLQGSGNSIPPARARFILENFEGDIVLLRGTTSELLTFARDAYTEASNIGTEIGAEYDINHYLVESDDEVRSKVQRYNCLTTGLRRLDRFLIDHRLTALPEPLQVKNDDRILQEYISDVHAKIAAERKRSTKSTAADAVNVAVSALTYTRSKHSNDAQTSFLSLVTQTSALLRFDKTVLLRDPAIKEMLDKDILFEEYLRSTYKANPATHALSFAFYCYYKTISRDPSMSLKHAMADYHQLIEANTIANRFFQRSISGKKRGRGSTQLIKPTELAGLANFWSTFCKTVPHALLGSVELAAQKDIFRENQRGLEWLSDTKENNKLAQQDSDFLARVVNRMAIGDSVDSETAVGKIGLRRKESMLNGNAADRRIEWTSITTQEKLLSVTHWSDDKFMTAAWETNADFGLVLQTVGQLVHRLRSKAKRVAVAAVYDFVNKAAETKLYPIGSPNSDAIDLPPQYQAIEWPQSGAPAPTSFISPRGGLTVFPETISVFSALGDFHFATPFSPRDSAGAVCNVAIASSSIDEIDELLKCLHGWQWNATVMDVLSKECRSILNPVN